VSLRGHSPVSFEGSWQLGEVFDDYKRANVAPIFKKGKKEDLGKWQVVSFTSFLGEIMEQVLQKVVFVCMKDKKVGTARISPWKFSDLNWKWP